MNIPDIPEHSKELRLVINYLIILIFLSACGDQNSVANILKSAKNVSSWAATANMVGDSWIHGAVPNNYAEQTLKKAQEELVKESSNIVDIKPNTDKAQRSKSVLLPQVLLIASQVKQMSIAVAQKNYLAMQQQLKELAAAERVLDNFSTISEQKNEKNL